MTAPPPVPTPPPLPADPVVGAAAPFPTTRRRVSLAVTAAVGLAGLAVLWFNDPVNAGFFPKCVLFQTTGLQCAGCGATRAVYALVHGRPDVAVRHNLLLVLFLPVLAWSFVRFAREALAGRHLPHRPLSAFARWAIVFLVAAFMVLRNVPREPFSYLAPPPAGASTLGAR